MEIAASAANEKRRFALAVFYDELCRKEWAERASRGDIDFDVNIVSMVKDLEILARARIAYDGASKQQLCLHLLRHVHMVVLQQASRDLGVNKLRSPRSMPARRDLV